MPPAKVLLFDDEPYVTRILKKRVEAHGYEVLAVTKPEACLEQSIQWNPHLIVLDFLTAPDLPGLQVCRKLKENPKTARIPVIFFTTLAATGIEVECVNAGAAGILYKPTLSDLFELMEKILAGQKEAWFKNETDDME